MKKLSYGKIIVLLLITLFVVACTNDDASNTSPNEESPNSNEENDANDGEEIPQEEVTLSLGLGNITETEVNRYIEIINEHYPHFNFELVPGYGSDLEERVLAGEVPDIIFEEPLNLSVQFIELGLEYNMDELIAEHNFDLGRIRPEFVEGVFEATDRDHMIAIPFHQQPFAIMYNKAIFDQFAVSYPEDGSTWDEMSDIAMELAREEDGVHYYGLDPGPVMWGAYQLGLPWIDMDNMEAVFYSTSEWHELFELWYTIHDRQGLPPEGHNIAEAWGDGSLAMRHGSATDMINTVENMDWMDFDIVTYPENPAAPGVGQRITNVSLLITSTSEHKHEAMQAISVLLSDEVQEEVARFGRMSVLDDPSIHDDYGAHVLPDEGGPQNARAFVEPELAPVPTFGNVPAHTFAINAFNAVLNGENDIDTALREADDEMNQAIQDMLGSE